MWQYMLICGVGAKPVTHLMQYHLLQWEVAKVKPLMNSNMTLTVLNLHQKTPKGATANIQVKRYERYNRHKIVSHIPVFIYLFMVLRRFQHCTGHITTGSWKGRGNQYIQFVRVLYCKVPTNGKQLPAFPHEAMPGIELRPQRWEARVLPLCHRGPLNRQI